MARYRFVFPVAFVIAAASGLGAAGCELRIDAAPPKVVHGHDARIVTPPSNIISQPRIFYKGAYAYLWDDRWFYPTPDGWVYFRTEPQPLYEHRTRYAEARAENAPGTGKRAPIPGR